MKAKIKADLIAKYKAKGFSDKAIDAMVDYLAATITDENQIEAAINGAEPIMNAFQAEVDSRVTAAVNKAKGGQPGGDPNPGGGNAEPNKGGGDDAVPSWAQKLMDKVDRLETGKMTDSRRGQLETALKDAPEAYRKGQLKAFDRMTFKDDDDFATYLTETSDDAKAQGQHDANHQLGGMGRPIAPGAQPTTKKVDDDIAAWSKTNQTPAAAATV